MANQLLLTLEVARGDKCIFILGKSLVSLAQEKKMLTQLLLWDKIYSCIEDADHIL